MKFVSVKLITCFAVFFFMISYLAAEKENPMPGKAVFKRFCLSCHPKGGNRIAKDKTLKDARQMDTFKSFLLIIRNPPKRMPSYSPAAISDKKAKQLYDYILEANKNEWK